MIIIGGVRYRPEDVARLGLIVKDADPAATHDSAITSLLSTPAGQTAVEKALAENDAGGDAGAAAPEPLGTQPLSAGLPAADAADAPPAQSADTSDEPETAPASTPAPIEPAPTTEEGATSGNTPVSRGRRGSRNADRSAN